MHQSPEGAWRRDSRNLLERNVYCLVLMSNHAAPCHAVVDVYLDGLLVEDIVEGECFCGIVSSEVGAGINVFRRFQP